MTYDELIEQEKQAFYQDQCYDKTIDYATQAITLDAARSEAYQARALAYMAKQDYDVCIRDCSKAIECEPNDALLYPVRAEAYHAMGDFNAAIKDLDNAITPLGVAKGCDKAIELMTIIQTFADHDKAIALIQVFVNAYHLRAIAYSFAGDCKIAMQELDNAETNCDNAIEYCRAVGHADAISFIVESLQKIGERKRELETILALQGIKIVRLGE